ncbi:hypothetical protein KIPB_001935, partial [Kipferlia bialata]
REHCFQPVSQYDMRVGAQVVPGLDFDWDNQDQGHVGTLKREGELGMAVVHWRGRRQEELFQYKVGKDRVYELFYYCHVVTMHNFIKGAPVVRGPSWRWGNQDGNGEGVLDQLDADGWCWVLWNHSRERNRYRIGGSASHSKYDIAYADTPAFCTGVSQ